jgi:hypothetical protein
MPKSPHGPRNWRVHSHPVENEERAIASHTLLRVLLEDPKVEVLFHQWDLRWGLRVKAQRVRALVDRVTEPLSPGGAFCST